MPRNSGSEKVAQERRVRRGGDNRKPEPSDLLKHLEQTAEALGITIRYEPLGDDADVSPSRSGSCRLRSDRIILVDARLGPAERCRVLVDELKRFEISNIYVPPMVRRLLGHSEDDY